MCHFLGLLAYDNDIRNISNGSAKNTQCIFKLFIFTLNYLIFAEKWNFNARKIWSLSCRIVTRTSRVVTRSSASRTGTSRIITRSSTSRTRTSRIVTRSSACRTRSSSSRTRSSASRTRTILPIWFRSWVERARIWWPEWSRVYRTKWARVLGAKWARKWWPERARIRWPEWARILTSNLIKIPSLGLL